jgi:MFS family permease
MSVEVERLQNDTVREFRHGWPTLTATLLGQTVGVHALPPYTIGFFMTPLQSEFGWSRTEISFGITVLTLAIAIGVPVAGSLVDRWGERRLIAAGMLFLAAGFAAMSAMGSSVGYFWVIMASMALFGSGCSPVTLSRALVSVFNRARGTALGITLIGTGLTSLFVPLLLAPIMSSYGWRTGYLSLAAVMLICLPIIIGLLVLNGVGGRPKPRSEPVAGIDQVSMKLLVKQPTFLALLAAFFCIALAIGGIIVHFVPMLIDTGYTGYQAAQTASLIGLSLIAGRFLTGIAVDHFFAPRVAFILMATSASGFVLLYATGSSFLQYAAALLGISFGAEIDLIAYLTSRYFPSNAYGRMFGILYSGTMLGMAVSPLVYARIRELTGHYDLGFAWAAALLCISAVLFMLLPRFPYGMREQNKNA